MMWESDNSTITGELLAVPFISNPRGGSVFEDFAQSPILLKYGFANKWPVCAGTDCAFQEVLKK